jgi:hypothetical protein
LEFSLRSGRFSPPKRLAWLKISITFFDAFPGLRQVCLVNCDAQFGTLVSKKLAVFFKVESFFCRALGRGAKNHGGVKCIRLGRAGVKFFRDYAFDKQWWQNW